MKRRSFITGLLALIPAISFPVSNSIPSAIPASTPNMAYALNNYPAMMRVVESFPKSEITDVSNLHRTLFLSIKHNVSSNDFGLTMQAVNIDSTQNYMLDKIFLEDDIEVLDFRDRDHTVSAIVSGSNRIAKKTRRSKGNHYTIFEDHVLVWFCSKNSKYDSPAQMVGNNLAYNSKYKDYFVRVKCNKLTDDDHSHLETLGYKRV